MMVTRRLKFDPGIWMDIDIEEPELCPLCGKSIQPKELSLNSYNQDKGKTHIAVTYLCKGCYEPFLAHYVLKTNSSGDIIGSQLLWVEPKKYTKREFDQALVSISPQFEKIYNQAQAAENAELDEIAGMGYRKAVEFLIKDYLIHRVPDERESIEKMELGKCISSKVPAENIKKCAQRCAWLGNDQTHYVKRFAELDLQVLKRFIDAVVYWIQMELVTEEASALEKR